MNYNIPRVKQFLHHINKVEAKIKARDASKKNLNLNIKSLSKVKARGIDSKLRKIEENIQELLSHERQLAQGHLADNQVTNQLNDKIEHLENTLIKIQTEDTQVINQLRDKVKDLTSQVKSYNQTHNQALSDFKSLVNSTKEKLSGGDTKSIKNHLNNISESLQKVKRSDLTPDNTRLELEKFENQLFDIVTRGLLPLSSMADDVKDLKQILAKLLHKLENRDKTIGTVEKRIERNFAKDDAESRLIAVEEKLRNLPDHPKSKSLHERINKLKNNQPHLEDQNPLPIPPIPDFTEKTKFNNRDISHGLEFSSLGLNDLSPIGDLDIPPPPKQRNKSLLSKFLGK